MPSAIAGSQLLPALIGAGGMMGASALGRGGGGFSQVPTLTPGQGGILEQLIRVLQPQIGQGITPYQGPRVPEVSPLQQTGFDIMRDYMPMAGEGQTVMQEAFGRFRPELAGQYQEMGGEALQKIMQDFDPEQITQIMKPVGDYATDIFKQDITPWVAEKYAEGGMGGAFPRALAKEGGRLSLGMASQFAPYQFQGQQAQLNRMTGVPGAAQNLGMMGGDVLNQALAGPGRLPMDIASGGFGAGGIQRGIAGEQLAAPWQKWQEAQPYENPWLRNFLPTALGTQAQIPAQQGPGMGALMLGPLSSMLGSDWFGDMMKTQQDPRLWQAARF